MSGPIIKLSIIINVLRFSNIIVIVLLQFVLLQTILAAFLDETKLFSDQQKGDLCLINVNIFCSENLIIISNFHGRSIRLIFAFQLIFSSNDY